VHTDVGHRCRGAKVHGKLVPLTTPLKMGDVVEIMTTKESKPSRDWLIAQHGYLTSSRARAKVLHWFKRQDFDRHVEDGRTIFERELKRLNLDNPNLEKLAQQLRFKNTDLMFASLGNGDLKLTQIVNAVQRDLQVKQEQPQEFTPQKIDTSRRKGDIDVSGVGNLLTQIANCCKPVPGDPIVGYVTQGRGVSIHHKNCKNILNVDDDLSNRLIEVDWVDNTRANYPVEVEIIAYDRPGLVGDVAQVLSNDKLSIINLVTTTNKKQHEARINVTIEINDLDILSKVIDRFNQIPNVHSVTRKRGND
jgi:GTP pyrophosphokinase